MAVKSSLQFLFILLLGYCFSSSGINIDKDKKEMSILYACTLLGKSLFNYNNEKIKFDKIVNALNIYTNSIEEAYNISNLIMLRECYSNLAITKAIDIISPNKSILLDDLTYLFINRIEGIFINSQNKNILAEELISFNEKIVQLKEKLLSLRQNKENKQKKESDTRLEEEFFNSLLGENTKDNTDSYNQDSFLFKNFIILQNILFDNVEILVIFGVGLFVYLIISICSSKKKKKKLNVN